MSTAPRSFSKKQALEKEVKELYVKGTFGPYTAATAVAVLTNNITYTKVATGPAQNGNTITIQVLPAAANPTNTILVAFTGTAAAVTITVTPNDGTNNGAVPVNLTTANLVQLINTGAVTGKTITLTDGSSLRPLATAIGGGAQNLVDGGEGDGVVAAFSGGNITVTLSSRLGVTSVTRTGVGEFTVVLDDVYYGFKACKGQIIKSTAEDLRFQLKSVNLTTKTIVLFTLTGAVATEPSQNLPFMVRFDLKNSTVA